MKTYEKSSVPIRLDPDTLRLARQNGKIRPVQSAVLLWCRSGSRDGGCEAGKSGQSEGDVVHASSCAAMSSGKRRSEGSQWMTA
jgi:hypothetical protein